MWNWCFPKHQTWSLRLGSLRLLKVTQIWCAGIEHLIFKCLLSHNQTPKHGSPQAQCTYPEPWAKFDSGHIMSYQRHSAQIIPYKTGWWFQPLRKILINWDDYSQYMEKKKFQITNQKNIKWPKLAHFSGLGRPVRSKNGQSEIPLCKSWLATVRTCCHLWQKMANHQIYQLL